MPSLARMLQTAFACTVAAFVVAFLFRHADHGAGEIIGGIAWFAFLLGLLAVVILAVAALATLGRRRLARR